LTTDLFDPVPLDKMTDAGHAVHDAAAKIPEEVCARFQTADKLSDADRTAIIEIARQALAPFQPKPAAKSEPDKEVGDKPGPAAKTGGRAEPKPDKSTPVSASKPEQKAWTRTRGGNQGGRCNEAQIGIGSRS